MPQISLADAKAHLSRLVDEVEAGETVDITRRGKAVARLTSAKVARQPIKVAELKRLVSSLPEAGESAESVVREMRNSDRY
jgi:prevent-host-death family protein